MPCSQDARSATPPHDHTSVSYPQKRRRTESRATARCPRSDASSIQQLQNSDPFQALSPENEWNSKPDETLALTVEPGEMAKSRSPLHQGPTKLPTDNPITETTQIEFPILQPKVNSNTVNQLQTGGSTIARLKGAPITATSSYDIGSTATAVLEYRNPSLALDSAPSSQVERSVVGDKDGSFTEEDEGYCFTDESEFRRSLNTANSLVNPSTTGYRNSAFDSSTAITTARQLVPPGPQPSPKVQEANLIQALVLGDHRQPQTTTHANNLTQMAIRNVIDPQELSPNCSKAAATLNSQLYALGMSYSYFVRWLCCMYSF